MAYRIESDFQLDSDWLSPEVFTQVYPCESSAIAVALEGVECPEEQEVRVVCTETERVVWRSTDVEYA